MYHLFWLVITPDIQAQYAGFNEQQAASLAVTCTTCAARMKRTFFPYLTLREGG